jgi:hypothetical protein
MLRAVPPWHEWRWVGRVKKRLMSPSLPQQTLGVELKLTIPLLSSNQMTIY